MPLASNLIGPDSRTSGLRGRTGFGNQSTTIWSKAHRECARACTGIYYDRRRSAIPLDAEHVNVVSQTLDYDQEPAIRTECRTSWTRRVGGKEPSRVWDLCELPLFNLKPTTLLLPPALST